MSGFGNHHEGRWADWAVLLGLALAAALTMAIIGATGAREARADGTVVFVKGVATAQGADGRLRFLGRGEALGTGEVVTTGAGSFAILSLADESRFTLRERSTFTIEAYVEDAGRENVVLRLFRGGFRAVTGLLARRRPGAFRVSTPFATIGVRGTEFDARLCEDDCAAEADALRPVQGASRARVVARVVLVRGSLRATRWDGRVRSVRKGGAIFQSERLETDPSGQAVVVFRDGTRISLPPGTSFDVERYAFDRAEPSTGSVLFRLIKGGLRAVTGFVARQRPRFFNVVTSSATIGIRGTGFDVFCDGECAVAETAPQLTEESLDAVASAPPAGSGAGCRAGQDLHVSVWDGAVGVGVGVSGGLFALDAGQSACLDPRTGAFTVLPATPAFIADNPTPRPDSVDVDLEDLFGEQTRSESSPGLFVSVREGHVQIVTADATLDLGDGEAGFVDPRTGEASRLDSPPLFMEQDPYPRPGEADPDAMSIIDLIDEDLRAPGMSRLECTL